VQLERQLRHRKESLGHVDATLRLLDPSIELDSIPTKRPRKNITLFRQGELGRMILKALRESEAPLSTAAIVSAVLGTGSHGERARPTLAPRVRGNLAYQEKRGIVVKGGNGKAVRWSLC
jgi:hypothetical protein